MNAAQYRVHGGGPSVTRLFLLRHPANEGITLIASQVFSFSSVASARWGFQALRMVLSHSGTIGTNQVAVNLSATPTPPPATLVVGLKHPVAPPATPYQKEQVPLVGNEDAGFKNTSAAYAGEYVFDNQVVLFRHGRYCAVVHISGNYAQVPLKEALRLAHQIAGRISS